MEDEIVKEWKFKKGRILFEIFIVILLLPLFLITGDEYNSYSIQNYFNQFDIQELTSPYFLISMIGIIFLFARSLYLFRPFAIRVTTENIVINRFFRTLTISWEEVDSIYLGTNFNFNNGWPNIIVVTNNGQKDNKFLMDIIAADGASLIRTLSQFTKVKGS